MATAPIDPSLRIASVRLAVADLARSAEFYERTLGLPLIGREEERALLGSDAAQPALELVPIADPVPLSPRSTGLFHVAWLHPTRAGLADTVRRIVASRWPIEGASDHGVSEALYLSDPDGLGIEIYADRPRERWQAGAGGHGVRMFTAQLDLEDLLAQGSDGPSSQIEAGTGIGHVHLKVADVPRAHAFYRDELGFEEMALLPSAAFLSAGGYHHHIGLNSWQSGGADAAPANAPGLRETRFTIKGASPRTLADPDGNALSFGPAPG
ncbi:MAG TPA: VOC family protein [Solirubrobacteraceae bacterium]|nr:VOC family protein [Solirubrobacteraceae bacterium]